MSKHLSITAEMNYLKKVTGQDEPTILAQAVKKGIDELYKEQIVSLYLKGRVSRKKVVEIIGAEAAKDIDYQKKAIEADIKWGIVGE